MLESDDGDTDVDTGPFSLMDSGRVWAEKGKSVLHRVEKAGEDTVRYCSVCSRAEELFELPGMKEKYCLECSADVAAAAVLVTEIDAGTLAGREVAKLVSECNEISSRLLGRAQSAELGF